MSCLMYVGFITPPEKQELSVDNIVRREAWPRKEAKV
jgi:hypothetical protein